LAASYPHQACAPDMREIFDPGFSILPLSSCERQACPIALHS
jgi:hypothetical protein